MEIDDVEIRAAPKAETAVDVFEKALNTIQNALSEADKLRFKRFTSHKDMISAVRRQCSLYSGTHQQLIQISQRIALFSDAFAPFFDIVNVFIQIKPDCAAIFWGTLWLIFKIGTNLTGFLERVSVMFEDMAVVLPQYESWFKICQQHRVSGQEERLAQSLALIYSDLIEFCVHIYFMFSKQNEGRLKRALLAGQLMLRPFESRFSGLKERISKHRAWFEAEAHIHQHGLISETYTSFREFLKVTEGDPLDQSRSLRADNVRQVSRIKSWINSSEYENIYDNVKSQALPHSGHSFLQIPQYLRLKELEFSGTSQSDSVTPDEWMQRVIFLQGKPGLGKTFASVKIINDLISHTPERSSDEPTTNVAFFHYSQLDKSKPQTSDGAFRAIAEQLVHTNRGNRLTLDALSLILSEKGSGQKTASGKDIREVLDILLKQHPVFIIIDGVDECMETETLLEQVRSLCLEHDCRFILIGRPDVRIPVRWEAYGSDNTWKVQLTHSLVNDDIGEYLKNGLQLLTLRGAFGRNIRTTDDLKATVNFDLFRTLANAAEGIFLWARLLLNLMNSPALTPAFRLEMLKCPAELVSLDVLYQKILDTLGEADGNEQRTAKNILQWLTFSAIPLSLTTLHTALAINVGRPTTELDYLTDYPDCIPRVTFSLVEVHILQNKASLIHLSFKEFLMSGRANNNNRPITTTLGKMAHMDTGSRGRHLNSYMSSSTNHLRTQQSYASRRGRLDDVVEENMGPRLGTNMTHYAHMSTPIVSQGFTWDSTLNIQLHLAAVCLSYLIHDVPPRPLQKLRRSQSSHRFNIQAASNTLEASAEDVERLEDGPSIDTIVTQFPFLRYSALCWYHHLSIEHHLHGSPFEISSILFGGHESSVAWIPLLAQFLVSRATVTTWVESAYMFRLAPRLDHLIPLLRYLDLDTRPMNAEAREKYWIILGVRQLAGALYHLYERHSQMLFENPTLIWQQDIEKAEDPSFWPVWQEEPDIRIALPPSPFYQDAPMRGDQNVLPTAH